MSGFEEAAASFRKRLSVEHIQEFQKFQNIDDLSKVIRAIESEQSRRKALRNLNKIRPFVNSLNDYARVIEVFVTCKPDILGLIWGPIKFCLQIASKSVKAFDALLDAYRRIGESIPVVSGIGNTFKSNDLVMQILGNVYEDILLFHKRAIAFFKRPGWEMLWQLTSRTLDDLFGDVVANLSRSKQLLLEAANVAHYAAANDDRMMLSRRIEIEEQIESQRRKIVVQEWLSAVNCEDIHNELRELRKKFPSTTEWILRNDLLRRWLKEPLGDQLFWLSGIPGAGKTVIFSSIVDHLGQIFQGDTVVYFYCKHNDELRNHFSEVIRSMIAQLTWNNKVCLEYLYTKILAIGSSRTTSRKTYHELVQALVQGHSRLFFCIDGLDECEDIQRRDILNLILRLRKIQVGHSRIRFFLAACAERDIEQSLQGSLRLELTKLHLNSDITLYLRVMASEVSRKFDKIAQSAPNEFAAAIFSKVADRPEGMFLLATLIMENLVDQETIEDLEEELRPDVLPRGIDQAYGRIVFRIRRISNSKQLERIKTIFELLLTSRRTLKLYEIQGALTVNTTNQTVDFEQRRFHDVENFIKEKCGPIVKVASNRDVELVHSSAKSYLQDLEHGLIDQKRAELNMASICTASVSSLRPAMVSAVDLVTKACRGGFAFQEYATLNWLQHLKSIIDSRKYAVEDAQQLQRLALDLIEWDFGKDSTFSREESGMEDNEELEKGISRRISTALEKQTAIRALFSSSKPTLTTEDALIPEGYVPTIPTTFTLLSQCRDAIENAFEQPKGDRHLLLSAYGDCPFRCRVVACRRFILGFRSRKLRDDHLGTHERSFKCIERDCDFFILGFPSQRALELHTSLSHEPGSKVLFPNLKPQTVWAALEAAIDDNDCDAVRQLSLEAQALENHPRGLLLRALTQGHIKVAGVLIDHFQDKADLHYVQKNGDNSFYRAAQLGNLSLFKRLLELTDYTLPARQAIKYSALVAAAGKGSTDILSLIYSSRSAPVLEYEHAAALRAVEFDQETALKFFDNVKCGVDVSGKEFLRTAEVNKSKSCIKYLLQQYGIPEECAGIGIENVLSNNIDQAVERYIKFSVDLGMHRQLKSAVNAGDVVKAENLLEQGADINFCSINDSTVLFEAASAGNETMVHFLLDNKANVSQRQSYKENASLLDMAFHKSLYILMSVLIESGARFSPELEDNAIMKAVARGDEKMVGTLLKFKKYSVHGIRAALERAAEKDDHRIARLIVVSGIGVESGNHALQLAAFLGHDSMVRLLLDLGMKSDELYPPYGTALQCAITKGFDSIVRLLIEKGVNVNQQDHIGLHVLWTASERGQDQIVQLLLDHGADPNLQVGKNGAALHIATRENHVTVMRSLIQKGADVNLYSWQYGTPLNVASKHKSTMATEVLLKDGADPNTASDEYGGALYSACENDSPAVVQLLLEAGADIQASVTRYGKPGCTPLQVAAWWNHKDVVRVLIDHGADVNNPASIDGNALYVASKMGHIEVMQQLSDAGANISFQDLRSEAPSLTALQIASKNGHESAVKLLLDHGASPMNYGSEGSALYLASEHGHITIVQILLETHVALSISGSNELSTPNFNPLDVAFDRGHMAIVELLLRRGADFSKFFYSGPSLPLGCDDLALLEIASENNCEHFVRMLLARGAHPDGSIGYRATRTPLYLASKEGHNGIVRKLIDAGANTSFASWPAGWDPLRAATENGHDEVVKFLLERGTNLKVGTSMDASLYMAVAHRRDKVVELLLKFGADADRLVTDFPTTSRYLASHQDYKYLQPLFDNHK